MNGIAMNDDAFNAEMAALREEMAATDPEAAMTIRVARTPD